MSQCQFVYQRARGPYLGGARCNEMAAFLSNTLCRKHHSKNRQYVTTDIIGDRDDGMSMRAIDNSFPRTLTDTEMRDCVTEARRRTSPEHVGMRVCAICGRLQVTRDLLYQTTREVKQFEHLLRGGHYY